MSKVTVAVIAALLAAVAVVVGCGGGESSQLTKAEFIKQGDVVCRKADREKQVKIEAFMQSAQERTGKPFTASEQEEFVTEAVLPPIRVEAEELRDLGVPDEPLANEILDELEADVQDLEEDPAKLAGKVDPFADVATMAGEYGFKACFLYY